ncbi:hypothetical protein Acor_17360 [Acrocarpospora corrugata]|uniref:Uncharacterized protein n=1 Tax=Acrocarpospora corrugata TaxID=35763 RepID=A0A5M3VX68_9ACTN|nr:hypothetical protein [Acrocarpospora corrugata]GER99672.1 hypothetical protein Acor_17360 [Acrocarpospora corrugata]
MNDLTYARVALDEGRTVNELGVLQRNGQNVDLYAAKLSEARIRIQAVLALSLQVLGIE